MHRRLAVLVTALLFVAACDSGSTDEAEAGPQTSTQAFITSAKQVAPTIFALLGDEEFLDLGNQMCFIAKTSRTGNDYVGGLLDLIEGKGLEPREQYSDEFFNVRDEAHSILCP